MVSNNSIRVDGHDSYLSFDDRDDSEDLEILDDEVSESNMVKTIEIIIKLLFVLVIICRFLQQIDILIFDL